MYDLCYCCYNYKYELCQYTELDIKIVCSGKAIRERRMMSADGITHIHTCIVPAELVAPVWGGCADQGDRPQPQYSRRKLHEDPNQTREVGGGE